MKNKKYTVTKRNNGVVPDLTDKRIQYVSVSCGKCIECAKQKGRNWRVRLIEEIRAIQKEKALFITLTYNSESLSSLQEELNIKSNQDNKIAILSVRRFLERWRKTYKKSLKHWLVTELGHNGTERLHLHGIIWTNENQNTIQNKWQYGFIRLGTYVNEKTINYIVKYVTKVDVDHKYYQPQILCSPGIGKNYLNRSDSGLNEFKLNETNEMYRNKNGVKLPLPQYYRQKIYSDDEKERLWIEKLNKEERYVLGTKIDISTKEGLKLYEEVRNQARQRSSKLGYNKPKNWDKNQYEIARKEIEEETRLHKHDKNHEILKTDNPYLSNNDMYQNTEF